ncbi:MAG: hypothetical protein OEZ47_15245, partial [Gammaproteobacteria bacterium]|nr:hypothetical protein [Gammaproteobacteria bacterium]
MGFKRAWYFSLFLFLGIAFPIQSKAAFVDHVKEGNISYFLFAAPNKIARYDLSTESFLED